MSTPFYKKLITQIWVPPYRPLSAELGMIWSFGSDWANILAADGCIRSHGIPQVRCGTWVGWVSVPRKPKCPALARKQIDAQCEIEQHFKDRRNKTVNQK